MSLFDIEIYWYSRISSANIAHLSNWTTLNNQCAVWFCLGTIVPADDASNAYDIENQQQKFNLCYDTNEIVLKV